MIMVMVRVSIQESNVSLCNATNSAGNSTACVCVRAHMCGHCLTLILSLVSKHIQFVLISL